MRDRVLGVLLAASTAVFAAAVSGRATAQEWPRFRGPGGQGHGQLDLPGDLTPQHIRWRAELRGVGHSSPVLWGKRVFLTRIVGSTRAVVCFDADNGNELWTAGREFEAHDQHKLNNFASATMCCDADAVYGLWTDGPDLVAAAFDHDGKQAWRHVLGTFKSNHGSAMAPVLCGDLVVIANENQGPDSFLTALDRKTGEPVWRIDREANARWAQYSPPLLFEPETGDPFLLVASSAHGLTAIEPATGELRWQADPGFKYRFIATPTRCGNRLFVNTGAGNAGKECAVFDLGKAGATEPAIAYRPRRGLPYVPAAIAIGQRYFWFSDSGYAVCLQADTGDELWRERTDARYFSSPVTNGETIFVCDRAGTLRTFSATGDEHTPLGELDLGSPTCATPAIAHDRLYIRTETELLALGRPQGERK